MPLSHRKKIVQTVLAMLSLAIIVAACEPDETLRSTIMRITIDIDEKLMKRAMKASRASTKREMVEKALRMLAVVSAQKPIRRPQGKPQVKSDLNALRRE